MTLDGYTYIHLFSSSDAGCGSCREKCTEETSFPRKTSLPARPPSEVNNVCSNFQPRLFYRAAAAFPATYAPVGPDISAGLPEINDVESACSNVSPKRGMCS